MRGHIDGAGAGRTAEARAPLDRLEDSEVVSLGVLSGADLCTLGATGHPVCWGELTVAWERLDEKERERLAETSTLGLLHRDLIKDQPPGQGVPALIVPACYEVSAELGILLAARTSPALIIATHHEYRVPAITYFQPQGACAIVEEIPERAGSGTPETQRSPLGVIFSYRLLTPAFAAGELARWALKPIRVGRYQPKPPRLICFFGCDEGGSASAYQLNIHADGRRAHVDGPDISAEIGRWELTSLMTDLVTTWIGAGLPRDHQAGAALARGRGHGGGDGEGTVRSG